MVYTEVKTRNGKRYFYRVASVRTGKNVSKKRLYLGVNLSNSELLKKEEFADEKLLSERRKMVNKEIEKIKPKIIEILKKYNIKKAGLFGSYVRGEQKKGSDIDILIEYPKGLGGFEFVGIALDLEKKLKKKIDLLTYGGISPYLKKHILEGEVKIL